MMETILVEMVEAAPEQLKMDINERVEVQQAQILVEESVVMVSIYQTLKDETMETKSQLMVEVLIVSSRLAMSV